MRYRKPYTYKEAYDKLISAYFKDEIQPYSREFCFCGTLGILKEPNFMGGIDCFSWDTSLYESHEYLQMEGALLWEISNHMGQFIPEMVDNKFALTPASWAGNGHNLRDVMLKHPEYENALFSGFCKALDVLKEIHLNRGEVIDEVPVLEKRVLISI